MRIFLLLLFLFFPGIVLSLDGMQETTAVLKHRLAKDIIPFLEPYLSKDGRISGIGNKIIIKSNKSNINELFIIIGDLDRIDYMQLIISITMNIQSVHNLNTRSIQVGENTWTKINYGITYSKRIRETLPNGHLVEKIKYVKVIESFQLHAAIDETNQKLTLKLRPSQDEFTDNNEDSVINTIEVIDINELSDNNIEITIKGNINKWISLSNAINTLYISSDEDSKTIRERQKLIRNLGIKVQLLK
ncbi:MAG: hypothetical protein ACC657_04455 [Thiohalomonadales bacterium]